MSVRANGGRRLSEWQQNYHKLSKYNKLMFFILRKNPQITEIPGQRPTRGPRPRPVAFAALPPHSAVRLCLTGPGTFLILFLRLSLRKKGGGGATCGEAQPQRTVLRQSREEKGRFRTGIALTLELCSTYCVPPSVLRTSGENALQCNIKIKRQVRHHVVMGLVASGRT